MVSQAIRDESAGEAATPHFESQQSNNTWYQAIKPKLPTRK